MDPVPDTRGFVPNPSGRGTIDILWSCITTLGLCTWTSLHIDLPTRFGISIRRKQIRISSDHRLLFKIWWMSLMILTPEFVLFRAVFEWYSAYCAMTSINKRQSSVTDIWTMTDGFFLGMDGFTYHGHPIDISEMEDLIDKKKIPPQPSRAQEIRDKSKSDALGKALTCAQALWLVIQCLARTIQHLPMSTLEFGTIGYVFVAVAVNSFYWYKPKDVLTPLEVLSWEGCPSHDGEDLDINMESDSDRLWVMYTTMVVQRSLVSITIALGCGLYGGWHCLAWNFVFPSDSEKRLWRIASILTALPGLIRLMPFFASEYFSKKSKQLTWDIFYFSAMVLYILSRGFILVEMFIGFRRLPAGVFDTVHWTTFVPHL